MESVSECESVSQICVQKNFHACILFYLKISFFLFFVCKFQCLDADHIVPITSMFCFYVNPLFYVFMRDYFFTSLL